MTRETAETGAAGQGLPFPPFRRPRPWRASRPYPHGAGQVGVGQTLADDALGRAEEAHPVGHLAVVEPEGLLVQVAEKVERLDADVGSLDRPLEERPKFSMPLVWIFPSTYFSAWLMTPCTYSAPRSE